MSSQTRKANMLTNALDDETEKTANIDVEAIYACQTGDGTETFSTLSSQRGSNAVLSLTPRLPERSAEQTERQFLQAHKMLKKKNRVTTT